MLRRISRCARLCENTVHGSTRLTTNGVVSLEIEYLSVRPEHRRRAPREFSHSLALEMTKCFRVRNSKSAGGSHDRLPNHRRRRTRDGTRQRATRIHWPTVQRFGMAPELFFLARAHDGRFPAFAAQAWRIGGRWHRA